jgi:hypothetical protein
VQKENADTNSHDSRLRVFGILKYDGAKGFAAQQAQQAQPNSSQLPDGASVSRTYNRVRGHDLHAFLNVF